MNSPTLKIKIEADTNNASQNIKKVDDDTKKLSQTTKNTTANFSKADGQLKKTGGSLKNLGQTSNLTNSNLKNLTGGFGNLIGGLSQFMGVAVGVGSVVAILKKSFNSLKDAMSAFADANSQIIRGTDATGQKLNELNSTVNNVAKNSVFSFKEIGGLVAGIETLFELSPEKNQQLAEWISKLATITNMSTNDILDNINQIHNATGTSIDLDLFNKLAATSKNTNKYYQQILQTLGEYSATLKTIGVLGFDNQLKFLTNIAKKGFDPSQITAQFGILSKKIIETSQKTGQSTLTIFSDVIDKIKNAQNEDDLLNLGIDIQGRQLANLQNAINAGALSVENLNGGFNISNDLLEKTYATSLTIEEQFKILGNEFLASLIEPAKELMPIFIDLMKAMKPIFSILATNLATVLKTVFKIITPFFKILEIVLEINSVFEPFLNIFFQLYEIVGEFLVDLLIPVLNVIKMLTPILFPVLLIFELIAKVLQTIVSFVKILVNFLSGNWSQISTDWNKLGETWSNWETFKTGKENKILEVSGINWLTNLNNQNTNQNQISIEMPEQNINTNLVVDGKVLASTLSKVGGEKTGNNINQRVLRNW